MKFLNLVVRFTEEEERLARDIFSGKVKRMILPRYLPYEGVREFLLVSEGAKPGLAVVKVSAISYVSPYNLPHYFTAEELAEYSAVLKKDLEENPDQSRLFTIVQIESVTVIPMDFTEVQNSRYLQGKLTKERDTEQEHSDILGKLTGP